MRKKRYTLFDVEGAPRRRGKRIALWSAVALVLIIVCVAAGSYLWFRAEVSSANDRVTPEIRSALQQKPSTTLTTAPGQNSATQTTAAPANEPSPSAMNLLVIGSDRRADDASLGGRSDTLMIVHIDPDQDFLSVLSLPRDLRVQIPGHGRGKLNTAFAFGGPALAIKTIEQTTGVDINHYLEVGFDAFKDMVDSLGGVYVDVDRRYYNPEWHYEPIDIYPGYQLLDGSDALDYVRFRHDRNADFGRMVRQQRFMSALREQAMGWDLPFKLPGLVSALFRNVATDLDANEILRLTTWGIRLSGDQIRNITLTGTTPTINGAAYVVASEDQLARAVDRLLYRSALQPVSDDTTGTTADPSTTTGGTVDVSGVPAQPASPDTIPQAEVWKEAAAEVPYAVQAPGYIPEGYAWTRRMPDKSATYGIKVDGGEKPAFRMLYALETNEDQVLGITETTWLDAPAASEGVTVTHGDVVYTVVRAGQSVDRVWWKADGVLYWISNTLSHMLDQEEMLKIAQSMISIPAR